MMILKSLCGKIKSFFAPSTAIPKAKSMGSIKIERASAVIIAEIELRLKNGGAVENYSPDELQDLLKLFQKAVDELVKEMDENEREKKQLMEELKAKYLLTKKTK